MIQELSNVVMASCQRFPYTQRPTNNLQADRSMNPWRLCCLLCPSNSVFVYIADANLRSLDTFQNIPRNHSRLISFYNYLNYCINKIIYWIIYNHSKIISSNYSNITKDLRSIPATVLPFERETGARYFPDSSQNRKTKMQCCSASRIFSRKMCFDF